VNQRGVAIPVCAEQFPIVLAPPPQQRAFLAVSTSPERRSPA